MGRTVIINCTALGSVLSGIGVYLLGLLTALTKIETDLHFIIYLNRSARGHVECLRIPPNMTIRWTTRFLSPDYGFPGHLLRLLYANYLSFRHPRSCCFNGSQLEAMLFRRRQILTVHDIIPLLEGRSHGKQYYYFRYVLPRALRSAAAIVVPSFAVKEHLLSTYGLRDGQIHVIYHGVEHARGEHAETAVPKADRYILYIGGIRSHKNLVGLLEGFRRVHDELPHRLVIIGFTGSRRRFLQAADPDRIVFKGHVSSRERASLYRNASLLVFPSRHEGFGFPPLEAMLNACPVVASHASCIPEVCSDAAYYVDPDDAESIAEGMRRVASDERVRSRLILRGLQRASSFPWKASAAHHVRLFRKLLSL